MLLFTSIMHPRSPNNIQFNLYTPMFLYWPINLTSYCFFLSSKSALFIHPRLPNNTHFHLFISKFFLLIYQSCHLLFLNPYYSFIQDYKIIHFHLYISMFLHDLSILPKKKKKKRKRKNICHDLITNSCIWLWMRILGILETETKFLKATLITFI